MASELLDLTALQAGQAIEAKEVEPGEYLAAWREAAAGDELNAYLWLAESEQPQSGGDDASGARGVPIAVKDIFCTEGIPTTAGSRILEGYRPPYPATAGRRLREAGVPLLGKTNMDEFAMGSTPSSGVQRTGRKAPARRRSPSRTSSAPRASRPRPARGSSRGIGRRTRRPR